MANFLVNLHETKGCRASTLAGYRAAIATVHKGWSKSTVSSEKSLSDLIKGIFNSNPSIKPLLPNWDLPSVLWALTKHPFEPIESMDLKFLIWKTVFLVALASASRVSELHALSIKESNYREESTGIRLLPNLQFLAKTQRLGRAWNPIFIPRFDRFATESDDLLLCPCRCLKMYRKRTRDIRDQNEPLFITYQKNLHRPAAKGSISRWIVSLIRYVYENSTDLNLREVRAHDTRRLASSWALFNESSLREILQAAHWASENTFTSFYLKDVSWDVFEKDVIRWKEEDGVYSESHGFPAMLDQVRSQPYMTFVGVPGSGKSATIHHIALILQKEEYEVVPIIDIRKIEDYSDSRHPQVFVIDDVVGVHGLQKQKLESLIDYEKRISDPSNRNTKVLMSCREAVFNECYKSFFSNENNTIKMHSSENVLNDEDKKAILQKHGLDRDLLTPTLLGGTLDMFPLLCKLYSNEEKFRNNVERFFTYPAECILEQFDKMQKQNSLCYATLVLCMLNEKKLSKVILKNTENNVFEDMKSKLLESCEVESNTDTFKFVKALAAMEGTYTKLCGTEYTIIHDSVFEILVYHYGCQFPDLLLQYISSSYIANNVKVQECKEESEVEYKQDENEEFSAEEQETLSSETIQDSFELCIRLREDQYPMLAERLYRDIENMELYDVFMNNVLKHPRVCQAFIEVLKTKSYTELKSLFLSEQKDVSKVVSKGRRVWEESKKGVERRGELRRQEVLLNENILTGTYSVRVISWVVYYGHSQILQYILEQTELHKETEIELFWNSFSPKLIYETNERRNNSEKAACQRGHMSLVKELIEAGADINPKGWNYTPLTAAIKGVVKEAIKAGVDINQQGGEFHTPLTAALKELIEARDDINPKGKYNTPLTAACHGGHMSLVKELIEAGADINPKGKYNTPLTAACKVGHMSLVKELIEAGADINPKGKYNTPLTAACHGGHMSLVKELIEAGADINPKGKYNTPLTAACFGEHRSLVKELIEAGVDINPKGKYYTPLTAACKVGDMTVVKELLEAGADINPQCNHETPLTAACERGHVSIVKMLLEAGAGNILQDKAETPLTTGY
ncbi:uncharacterized protein LOC134275683 [Saccostrea cucullata]|uniref:uncharacterized protein LOC134275683 n=1 Tax=Saccostrea cuccullata TaxID=36930 RepID=UPI002ED0B91D